MKKFLISLPIFLVLFLLSANNAIAACFVNGESVPCSNIPSSLWYVFGVVIILGIVLAVLWFVTVIRAAKRGQMGWVIAHFVFGPLVSILYLAIGNGKQLNVPTVTGGAIEQIPPPIITEQNSKIKWGRIILAGIVVIAVLGLALYAKKKINEFRPDDSGMVSIDDTANEKTQEEEYTNNNEQLSDSEKRLQALQVEISEVVNELKEYDIFSYISGPYNGSMTKEEGEAGQKKYEELQEELNQLSSEQTKIQSDLTKMFISESAGKISSVHQKFCVNSKPGNEKHDYSTDFILKISGDSIKNLVNGLMSDKYSSQQAPIALQNVGALLMKAGEFDEAIKFYNCAAENYYEIMSMYQLIPIYKYGSDSYSESIAPGVVVKNKIEIDMEKAYYWIVAMIYTEKAEQSGLLDTATSFGWNTIAALDDIQMRNKLTTQQMIDVEDLVREFIEKRYPEVLEGEGRVIYHGM